MEIKELKEKQTAAIRTTVNVKDLHAVMGKSYDEVFGCMKEQGANPAGPPFAVYHNMDMEHLDVEIGFPVDRPIKEKGKVRPGSLPGGRTATTTFKGPYEGMEKPYGELAAFMKEKGVAPTGTCYEVYLNDPNEVPPEELLTEIYFPLK